MIQRFDDPVLPLQEVRAGQVVAQTKYSIRLNCYGCVGMTREWILQDNITPADVVVRMMFASMPENLRNIYFAAG